MKLQKKLLFALLISVVLFSLFIAVNLVFKKDFSEEAIREMDEPPAPQEIIEEMEVPSSPQEMTQEIEDPLSVLFNNTWLSEKEPKWWMNFEDNFIKTGPYGGGIALLQKFDVVEVDAEEGVVIIHVTELRWLNSPDFPDEIEKVGDIERITLKGKTMIYEHKFETCEKGTTIWIAE